MIAFNSHCLSHPWHLVGVNFVTAFVVKFHVLWLIPWWSSNCYGSIVPIFNCKKTRSWNFFDDFISLSIIHSTLVVFICTYKYCFSGNLDAPSPQCSHVPSPDLFVCLGADYEYNRPTYHIHMSIIYLELHYLNIFSRYLLYNRSSKFVQNM